MKFVPKTFAVLALSLLIGCKEPAKKGATSEKTNTLKIVLDKRIPEWQEEYNIPATGVGYIKNGEIQWTEVYGIQSPGVPVSDSTLFSIASMTKPVTAEVILKLVDKGKIALDEPMYPYFVDPDVKDDPRHKLLTPRIVLSHRTGFVNWRGQPGENGKLEFKFTPGEDWMYSGEGMDYLGRFAEKKLGKGFEQLAEENLFEPLDLHDITYSYRDWIAGRLVHPYRSDGSKEDVDEYVREKGNWSGGNLIITSVEDYTKFLNHVISGKDISKPLAQQRDSIHSDSRDYLRIEEQVGAKDSLVDATTKAFGFGLSWVIHDFGDEKIIEHGGSGWGVIGWAFYNPNTKDGMVILTNKGDGYYIVRNIIKTAFPDSKFNLYFKKLVDRIERLNTEKE